jgi:myo-inositol-1(or 4)-monophosphatase
MNCSTHHGTCARTVAKALLFLETMSSRELTFTEKESPRDLVSAADMAVHKLMCEQLEPTRIPVVSEENAASHALATQPMPQCWMLDPIDGTTNFATRIPLYGVSLALMDGTSFTVGSFGMPATRELFYTVSPDASYLNDARLRPIRKTLTTSLVGGCFSSRARSTQQSRNDEFRLFGIINDRSRGCLRLGSAGVSICYTAAGKLGATYGIAGKVWDVAAALAIARAAGCRILIAATPDPLAMSYVVGHGDVVGEIHAIVRDELRITSWKEG